MPVAPNTAINAQATPTDSSPPPLGDTADGQPTVNIALANGAASAPDPSATAASTYDTPSSPADLGSDQPTSAANDSAAAGSPTDTGTSRAGTVLQHDDGASGPITAHTDAPAETAGVSHDELGPATVSTGADPPSDTETSPGGAAVAVSAGHQPLPGATAKQPDGIDVALGLGEAALSASTPDTRAPLSAAPHGSGRKPDITRTAASAATDRIPAAPPRPGAMPSPPASAPAPPTPAARVADTPSTPADSPPTGTHDSNLAPARTPAESIGTDGDAGAGDLPHTPVAPVNDCVQRAARMLSGWYGRTIDLRQAASPRGTAPDALFEAVGIGSFGTGWTYTSYEHIRARLAGLNPGSAAVVVVKFTNPGHPDDAPASHVFLARKEDDQQVYFHDPSTRLRQPWPPPWPEHHVARCGAGFLNEDGQPADTHSPLHQATQHDFDLAGRPPANNDKDRPWDEPNDHQEGEPVPGSRQWYRRQPIDTRVVDTGHAASLTEVFFEAANAEPRTLVPLMYQLSDDLSGRYGQHLIRFHGLWLNYGHFILMGTITHDGQPLGMLNVDCRLDEGGRLVVALAVEDVRGGPLSSHREELLAALAAALGPYYQRSGVDRVEGPVLATADTAEAAGPGGQLVAGSRAWYRLQPIDAREVNTDHAASVTEVFFQASAEPLMRHRFVRQVAEDLSGRYGPHQIRFQGRWLNDGHFVLVGQITRGDLRLGTAELSCHRDEQDRIAAELSVTDIHGGSLSDALLLEELGAALGPYCQRSSVDRVHGPVLATDSAEGPREWYRRQPIAAREVNTGHAATLTEVFFKAGVEPLMRGVFAVQLAEDLSGRYGRHLIRFRGRWLSPTDLVLEAQITRGGQPIGRMAMTCHRDDIGALVVGLDVADIQGVPLSEAQLLEELGSALEPYYQRSNVERPMLGSAKIARAADPGEPAAGSREQVAGADGAERVDGRPGNQDFELRQADYRAQGAATRRVESRYAEPLQEVFAAAASDTDGVGRLAADLSGRYGPCLVEFHGAYTPWRMSPGDGGEISLTGTVNTEEHPTVALITWQFNREEAGLVAFFRLQITAVDFADRLALTSEVVAQMVPLCQRSGVDRILSAHDGTAHAAAVLGETWNPEPRLLRLSLQEVKRAAANLSPQLSSDEDRRVLDAIVGRLRPDHPRLPQLAELAQLSTATEPDLGRRLLERTGYLHRTYEGNASIGGDPLYTVRYLQSPSQWDPAVSAPIEPSPAHENNCAALAAKELSDFYDRYFDLDVEPGPEGVPARALFEAVGCAARPHSYDDVTRALDQMEDGASAVLASAWADHPRAGGHAYLAHKIGGQIHLYDPHTGQLSRWPPHWGEDAVSVTAVGYLTPNGDPVDPLDIDKPDHLARADEVGHVKGRSDDDPRLEGENIWTAADVVRQQLTDRERQVLAVLAEGADPAVIAGRLNTSVTTVLTDIRMAMAKLALADQPIAEIIGQVAAGHADRVAALSSRERAVLVRLGEGLTNREIAAELGVSAKTVSIDIQRIMSELNVRSRVQLIGVVYEIGLERAGPLADESAAEPQRHERLGSRERELVSLLAQGFTDRQMAERAGMSPTSVKTYIGNIRKKLGAANRGQLVAIAYEIGLLEPGRVHAPVAVPSALATLTPSERDVMVLLDQGLDGDEIATRLLIMRSTVNNHIGNILRKLGAAEPAQLLAMAYESGLVRPVRGVNTPVIAATDLARLSPPQRAVTVLLAKGLSDTEIAARLLAKTSSVRELVGSVVSTVRADNRIQLVEMAYESGLVRPGSSTEVLTALEKLLSHPGRSAMALVAEGLSDTKIAARLDMVPANVPPLITRTMTKMGARDRTQLAEMAHQLGLPAAARAQYRVEHPAMHQVAPSVAAATGPVLTGSNMAALTAREREVMLLVGRGRSDVEIATELSITTGDASWYVSQAMSKLGARDSAHLAEMAQQLGVVPGVRHTGSPARPANCAQGVLDILSARYGRDFDLGVTPTPEGVPAKALFKAVGSAAHRSKCRKVARGLKWLGDGSAAVLASRWAGAELQGGHAYLAVNDGGRIYLIDGHTRQPSPWPPHWGQNAVDYTAVGYLDANGYPMDRLDIDDPQQLAAAEDVGDVQGNSHDPGYGDADAGAQSERELPGSTLGENLADLIPTEARPAIPQLAQRRLTELTDPQREVFSMLVGGFTNTQIANQLSRSEAYVRSIVSQILRSLGADDRSQLVAMAHWNGLVPADSRAAAPVVAPTSWAQLTQREREVLARLVVGFSIADINSQLSVRAAVAVHVGRIMKKVGADHRSQLVVMAYRSGVVSPLTPADGAAAGVSPEVPLGRRAVLTHRQGEVLALLVDGLSPAQVAAYLSIDRYLVNIYVRRILDLVNAADRARLAVLAHQNGLIRPWAEARTNRSQAEVMLRQRRRQVLEMLVEGLPIGEAAARLSISTREVNRHVNDILKTLGADNLATLAVIADGDDLLPPLDDGPGFKRKGLVALTFRERRVVALLSQGFTNEHIAARMFMDIGEVDEYVRGIRIKLGVGEEIAHIWALVGLRTEGSISSPTGLSDQAPLLPTSPAGKLADRESAAAVGTVGNRRPGSAWGDNLVNLIPSEKRAAIPRLRKERLAELTHRQYEVFALLVNGFTNPQIADQLGLTVKSANQYVSRILKMLRAVSGTQLVAMAHWNGVVPADSRAEVPIIRPTSWARLTQREREVLARVVVGFSSTDIAAELSISRAVTVHVSSVMKKLGAAHRSQLVVMAYRSGVVRPLTSGDAPAAPGPTPDRPARRAVLTHRQGEVLELLGEGLSPVQVAAHLSIDRYLVNDYVSGILRWVNTADRARLVALAHQNGLIPPSAEATTNRSRADVMLRQRRHEVLEMLVEGLTVDEAAARLAISTDDVNRHIHAILNSLGADNRARLVVIAARNDLLPDETPPGKPVKRRVPVTADAVASLPEIPGKDLAVLTPHERRVVRGLVEGLSNDEIAARLSMEADVVDEHVQQILMKLGAPDRDRVVNRYRIGPLAPPDIGGVQISSRGRGASDALSSDSSRHGHTATSDTAVASQARAGNCAYLLAEDLRALYGRDIRIDVEPSPRGVPARALFEAVGSAARRASYDEVAAELRKLGDGASAVLASAWAGSPTAGGHAYLAVNADGRIQLFDPHTGELSAWPPHWGQGAVSVTAVGYLKPSGDPVDPLDDVDVPLRLAVADDVGYVQGHRGDSDFRLRGHPDGERWREVPSGVDPLGQLAERALALRPRAELSDLRNPLGDKKLACERARANAAWWRALNGFQQRAVMDAYPQDVGRAEGIPASARHEINWAWLQELRTDPRVDRIDTALCKAAEAARLGGLGGPYLVAFDPYAFGGNGRAVVAFGDDPYVADSVTWIPGVAMTIDQLGICMSTALHQLQSTKRESPTLKSCALAWVGWKPPRWLAVSKKVMQAGGDLLDSDISAATAARDMWTADGSHFTANHVHFVDQRTRRWRNPRWRIADPDAVTTTSAQEAPGFDPSEARDRYRSQDRAIRRVDATQADPLGLIVDHAADQARIDQLAADLSGIYGPYRVELSGAAKDGRVRLAGAILNGSQPIGTLMVTFFRDNDGKLVVHHNRILINDEIFRGKGVYKALHRQLEPYYRRSGVDRMELTAEEPTGGYAAARRGVSWNIDPAALHESLERIRDWAVELARRLGPSRSEARSLLQQVIPRLHPDAPDLPTPMELAALTTADYPDLGRDLINGVSWEGVKSYRNDCAHEIVAALSAMYDCEIRIDREPSPAGVPARAVFEAVGSAAKRATYDDVENTLRAMGAGSSAILASSWSGSEGYGGHAYVAVYDGTEVYLLDPWAGGRRSGWPPYWGQAAVACTAAGYLDVNGKAVHRLDIENPDHLTSADIVGLVQGLRDDPEFLRWQQEYRAQDPMVREVDALYAVPLDEALDAASWDPGRADQMAKDLSGVYGPCRVEMRQSFFDPGDVVDQMEAEARGIPLFGPAIGGDVFFGDQRVGTIHWWINRDKLGVHVVEHRVHYDRDFPVREFTDAVAVQLAPFFRRAGVAFVESTLSGKAAFAAAARGEQWHPDPRVRQESLQEVKRSARQLLLSRALSDEGRRVLTERVLGMDPDHPPAPIELAALATVDEPDLGRRLLERTGVIDPLQEEMWPDTELRTVNDLRVSAPAWLPADEPGSDPASGRKLVRRWSLTSPHAVQPEPDEPSAPAEVEGHTLADRQGEVRALLHRVDELSRRDRDVLRLLGEGLTTDEIADRLSADAVARGKDQVDRKTAGQYIKALRARLGAHDRTQLVVLACLSNPVDVDADTTRERLGALTSTELDVLARLGWGLPITGVAASMSIPINDVHWSVNHLLTKLEARDLTQLVVLAHKYGVVGARPADTGSAVPIDDTMVQSAADADVSEDDAENLDDVQVDDVEGPLTHVAFLRRQQKYREQDPAVREVDSSYAQPLDPALDDESLDQARSDQMTKDLSGVYGPCRVEMHQELADSFGGEVLVGQRRVGGVHWRLKRDESGALVAEHELDVRENFPVREFSNALAVQLEPFLQRAGVVRIESTLSGEAAFAAAARGDQWHPNPAVRHESLEEIKRSARHLLESGGLGDDGRSVLSERVLGMDPNHPPAPIELAALATVAEPDLGRRLLAGTGVFNPYQEEVWPETMLRTATDLRAPRPAWLPAGDPADSTWLDDFVQPYSLSPPHSVAPESEEPSAPAIVDGPDVLADRQDELRPLVERVGEVSARDREVLILLGDGLTTDEIADRLSIGAAVRGEDEVDRTAARQRISALRAKLGARDHTQLVVLACLTNPVEVDAQAPGGRLDGLTSTEREVLVRVGWGLTNTEIAAGMSLPVRHVKWHLLQLLEKLEIRARDPFNLFREKVDPRDRIKLVLLAHHYGVIGWR